MLQQFGSLFLMLPREIKYFFYVNIREIRRIGQICCVFDSLHFIILIISDIPTNQLPRKIAFRQNFAMNGNYLYQERKFKLKLKYHFWLIDKESACQCRWHGFNHWIRKIPWRRKWQPTPVFLPRKSYGRRSLQAIVHRLTKSQARLSDWHIHKH